jgi:hypothetical protein
MILYFIDKKKDPLDSGFFFRRAVVPSTIPKDQSPGCLQGPPAKQSNINAKHFKRPSLAFIGPGSLHFILAGLILASREQTNPEQRR